MKLYFSVLILGLVILVIAAFIYLVSCIMLIRGTKHVGTEA